jgi:phage-related protein
MSIFSSLFDWLKSFFTGLLASLEGSFLWVFVALMPTFALIGLVSAQITAWLIEAAVWIVEAHINLLESLWGSCIGFVEGAIEWILEIAGEVIDFVIEEIAKIADAVVGVISNALGPLLVPLLIGLGIFFFMKEDDNKHKPEEI